jgi:hypothetical protein
MTSLGIPIVLDERIQAIELEMVRMRRLQVELIELKRRKNSLTLFCRLPTELLVEVFKHIQHTHPSTNRSIWDAHDPSWARIMLVCHHFRTIAIQTPALWTTVVHYKDNLMEWLELCYQRSAGAPLFMWTNTSYPIKQWHQAVSACLVGAETEDFLDTSCPRLESLTIRDACGVTICSSSFPNSSSLTCLRLETEGVVLKQAPSLLHLRHLILDSIALDSSLVVLAEFLAQAASLELLVVRHMSFTDVTTPISDANIMPSPPQIHLPQLRHLFVQDTPAETWALLRLLPVPYSSLAIRVTYISAYAHSGFSPNHAKIYEYWMEHSRKLPSRAQLSRGVVSISCRETALAFGHYIDSEEWEDSPSSFCSIGCRLDSALPVFDQFRILRLVGTLRGEDSFQDLDGRQGVRFLRELDTLVLHGLTNHELQEIKPWVILRASIKCIEAIGCSGNTQELTDELPHARLTKLRTEDRAKLGVS